MNEYFLQYRKGDTKKKTENKNIYPKKKKKYTQESGDDVSVDSTQKHQTIFKYGMICHS